MHPPISNEVSLQPKGLVNLQKKCAYDQRVREVEHGLFISLVLCLSSGCGQAAEVFFRRLASCWQTSGNNLTALLGKSGSPQSFVNSWN